MTSVIGFIVGLAMFGAIIFLPLYLQIVQGESPTAAGLKMIPMMIGMLGATVISGRLISRIGHYKPFPIIGTILATIGMLLLSRISVDTPYWQLALAMFVLGIGIGNVMQVLILAVQNSVNPREVGVATSGSTFFRSIGGTFGTAIFGAVMAAQLAAHIESSLPAGAQVDTTQMTSAMSAIAQLPEQIKAIVLTAFSESLSTVFLVAAPIIAVGIVFALLVPDVKLRGLHGHESAVMD